jgi:hypothetical protein
MCQKLIIIILILSIIYFMLYSNKLQENIDDTQVVNTQTNTQNTNTNIIPVIPPKTKEQILLETHNKYFKYHNPDAPDLKWNQDLAIGAKKWADYLSKTCTFDHSKTTGSKLTDLMRVRNIGENMGFQKENAKRDIAYLRKDYNQVDENKKPIKDRKTEIVSYNNVDAWYNDYLIDDLKQTYILDNAKRPKIDKFGKKIKNTPILPSLGECDWYKINSDKIKDKIKLDVSDPKWGHFTQVVWRNNNKQVEIGCGVSSSKENKTNNPKCSLYNNTDITVCRYSPAGNYYAEKNPSATEQKYRQNVIFPETGCLMRPVITKDTNNNNIATTTNTTS